MSLRRGLIKERGARPASQGHLCKGFTSGHKGWGHGENGGAPPGVYHLLEASTPARSSIGDLGNLSQSPQQGYIEAGVTQQRKIPFQGSRLIIRPGGSSTPGGCSHEGKYRPSYAGRANKKKSYQSEQIPLRQRIFRGQSDIQVTPRGEGDINTCGLT